MPHRSRSVSGIDQTPPIQTTDQRSPWSIRPIRMAMITRPFRPMIISIWTMIDLPDWSSDQLHRDQLTMIDIDPWTMIKIDPRPESTPGTPRPPRPDPPAPGTRYQARDARNAGTARPIPPAPIRTPDDRRSPPCST